MRHNRAVLQLHAPKTPPHWGKGGEGTALMFGVPLPKSHFENASSAGRSIATTGGAIDCRCTNAALISAKDASKIAFLSLSTANLAWSGCNLRHFYSLIVPSSRNPMLRNPPSLLPSLLDEISLSLSSLYKGHSPTSCQRPSHTFPDRNLERFFEATLHVLEPFPTLLQISIPRSKK